MLKKLQKVWHSWATIEHHSNTEICKATDTADFFRLGCVKMFLRMPCKQDPNFKRKFQVGLDFFSRKSNNNTPKI